MFIEIADAEGVFHIQEPRYVERCHTGAECKKHLESHGGDADQITEVGMDMSLAFIKGATENFPNAFITFDKLKDCELETAKAYRMRLILLWIKKKNRQQYRAVSLATEPFPCPIFKRVPGN